MTYVIMGAAAALIIALLLWIIRSSKKTKENSKKSSAGKNLQPVKCPICQTSLFVGENIYSKVYRPMNVPDQLCTVSGCPHCYPKCEPGVKRICPVCHKPIAQDQTLTARLFNKKASKKHVHIIGCSNCHKPRAD